MRVWWLVLFGAVVAAGGRGGGYAWLVANGTDAPPVSPVSIAQPEFFLWGYPLAVHVAVAAQLTGEPANVTWFVRNRATLVAQGWKVVGPEGAMWSVPVSVPDVGGQLEWSFDFPVGRFTRVLPYRGMPAPLCLLPPLTAILCVVLIREATLGLFFGVFVGSTLLATFNPLQGFLDSLAIHFVRAWTDLDNGSVVVFALFLGGWTALIRRSGGFLDLTARLMQAVPMTSRWAALLIFALGCIIQLSGHLSIFLLGAGTVDLSDLSHLSRDKLAFLIDSTAAPVASLSVVSSFMAVQTAYIEQEFTALGYTAMSPFEAFVVSIPQGFYQINVLVLAGLVSLLNRDLFVMHSHEREARRPSTDAAAVGDAAMVDGAAPVAPPVDPFAADPQFPWRWWNAVVPFVVLLAVTIASVFVIGLYNARNAGIESPTVSELLSRSRAVEALLWGIATSTLLLFVMLLVQGRKVLVLVDEWADGCKSMLPAMLMLAMAWALSNVVQEMHLGLFVGQALAQGLPPGLLPLLVLVLSCFVSFASGTSFGTMGVIFPISIPSAYALAPFDTGLMVTTIAATISGANAGDHSSPFSDTTILSALMAGIPNLQHTKSQLPYVLIALGVSVVCGFLPCGFGFNPWAANAISVAVLAAIVVLFGKHVGDYAARDKTCSAQDDVTLAQHGWRWLQQRTLCRGRRGYEVV